MAAIYNDGASTIGTQFNDKYWSRVSLTESAKKVTFGALADKLTQPKHYGDKIVKYHEIPIIDERNINDQGLDAAGAAVTGVGIWTVTDVTNNYYGTYEVEAEATAQFNALTAEGGSPVKTAVTALNNNGNLYGSSRDFTRIQGAIPSLTEIGGRVNRVGMTRLTLEATVSEYGMFLDFTQRSLDMDTETGLLTRYSKNLGRAKSEMNEAMIQGDLLKSAGVKTYGGTATTIATCKGDSVLTYAFLRTLRKTLNDNYCPTDTKVISGSTKIDTRVIGKARYVYVGSDIVASLEDMTHTIAGVETPVWVGVEQYSAAGNIMEGEIGKIGNFRFIEVDQMQNYPGGGMSQADAETGGETADTMDGFINDGLNYSVFPLLVVGSGSFATIGFGGGKKVAVKTQMPGIQTKDDPYGKMGLMAISWWYGFMALRPEWIARHSVVVPV